MQEKKNKNKKYNKHATAKQSSSNYQKREVPTSPNADRRRYVSAHQARIHLVCIPLIWTFVEYPKGRATRATRLPLVIRIKLKVAVIPLNPL